MLFLLRKDGWFAEDTRAQRKYKQLRRSRSNFSSVPNERVGSSCCLHMHSAIDLFHVYVFLLCSVLPRACSGMLATSIANMKRGRLFPLRYTRILNATPTYFPARVCLGMGMCPTRIQTHCCSVLLPLPPPADVNRVSAMWALSDLFSLRVCVGGGARV